ncbi:phosphoenolpyruvate--protein phosphotransferase [Pseudarthrobacter enclensis]|uniref:Phosphoenolpyruvate-protein phosphotransferase n=1 Tax=Pseudarthrobacter enclensis TaxID=993070 RepID=A0A0V8I7L1_9MICC|nr:phosphoenolpyruvate--protein phosphotransferase [Pseudarthrobacter enclensis]KSU70765.1 phosphoenolpyruvate-protein phosphotransferase [Pseudarthrobacter enclensis]SCC26205.1 phosphoenolpyruvate--protein phosphotransferase [Pseudarthrobacter enclensis]
MQNFPGVGVSPGRVIGTVRQMPKPISEPPAGDQLAAGTTAEEATAALKAAAQAVHDELKARAAHASGDGKAVLEATALMAKDTMLIKGAAKLVARGTSAERAIWESGSSVSEMLHNLGGYMAERATDVLDVRARIVAELRGVAAPGIPSSETPFVLVADDLAPADTATLDPNKVLALVTSGGGPQSHTAIIARSLGLPAVVAAVGVDHIADGTEVYVDGAAGSVTSEPDGSLRAAAEAWAATASLLAEFTGTGATADGHQVPLLANVGGGKDAVAAAKLGAQGVGLFRTEFCFLERDTEPSVEEQAAAYKSVFDAFPGKKVVLRTLDAGADKPLPFLTDSTEPNPALGVRGYRTDFTTPGVLDRQLEAIALAANQSEADVWVMAPMISTAEEAARFASMCADAGLKTPGVMVEVPSAALTAEAILREVGFASLGTNDLTQYAMAADRQLGPLANLNTPWQPAVLRLVGLTVEGSRAEGNNKPVGVCGEAAADPALAVVLAGLGVSTLSMTARSLAAVAAVLKTVTLQEAQELAKLALAAPSATEARARVREKLPVLEELGL